MAILCENPTPARRKFGFPEGFIQSIKGAVGLPTSTGDIRNIARRLGVDDTRTLNIKDTKGKKIFTKGLKDIEEWDIRKSPDGIPNDVVVSVPSPDGRMGFFISNKKTTFAPTKWTMQDGRIRPNPDWDAVGVNKTLRTDGSLQRYKMNDDGNFIATDGDGVFLNIQNPSRQFEGLDNDYIIRHNIDAIEMPDGSFRLIHEPSQVVRNTDTIAQKPNKGALEKATIETVPSEAQVEEAIKKLGIPARVSAAIAGGVVGSLIDEDKEYGGTFWGGALAFAMTSPKFRGAIRGGHNRYKDGGLDNVILGTYRAEKQAKFVKKAQDTGYTGDTYEGAQTYMEQIGNVIERDRSNGKNPTRSVLDSDWFQSGKGLMEKLGSVTAKKLGLVFTDFDNVRAAVYARLTKYQNQAFGGRGKKEAEQIQIDTVRRVYNDPDMTNEEAIEAFGRSTGRIATFGSHIDPQGRFVWDEDMVAANKVYENQSLRQLDEAILRDENAIKVYESERAFYKSWADEILVDIERSINNSIDMWVKAEHKGLARMIRDAARNDNLTPDQLENVLLTSDPALHRQWQKAMYDSDALEGEAAMYAFRRVIDLSDKYVNHHSLKDSYVPQGLDHQRMFNMKQEFINNPKKFDPDYDGQPISSMSAEEQTKIWDRYVSGQMLNLRTDKWTVMSLNRNSSATDTKYFGSRADAIKELDLMRNRISDSTHMDLLDADLSVGRIDDYIKEINTSDGKVRFFIEVPDRYKQQDVNLFESYNIDTIATTYRNMVNRQVQYTSDHFDHARKHVLPQDFLINGIEDRAMRYSNDIGIKLHNLKNRMYDIAEFETEWINPIRREVNWESSAYEVEQLGRVKDWYSTIQGLRKDVRVGQDMSEPERIAYWKSKAKNDSLLTALANFSVQPYLHGTTLYALFQPALFGSFFAGFKNTGKAYGHFFSNPQDLKNVTDKMMDFMTIRETFTAFSPEYKAQTRKELLGDVLTPMQMKTVNLSEKMVDFSASFSLVKPLVNNLAPYTGTRLEDMGLFRLMAGNLLDVSGAEAGLVTYATMRRVDELVQAIHKMNTEGLQRIDIDGRMNTLTEAKRELELLGIDKRALNEFVANKTQFNQFIERELLKGTPVEMSDQMYSQIAKLMNNVVSSYHSRNKFINPMNWVDNEYGKMLSRFSRYAQNFSIQTTKMRIYQPMKDWNDKYSNYMKQDANFFKLGVWASTGNDAQFKRVFGDQWEQAYNDFPVEAVHNFLRVFGALGIGHAMYISRGAAIDLAAIAGNELLGNDDYDAWRNVNKRIHLYNDPDTGEAVNFTNIFSNDITGYSIMKSMQSAFGMAIDVGFAGRWGQLVLDESRWIGRGGILGFVPAGSQVQGLMETFSNLLHYTDGDDFPKKAARELMRTTLQNAPNLGTYYDLQRAIESAVFEKPMHRNKVFMDMETNTQFKPASYGF
jgi:hypothetical protein